MILPLALRNLVLNRKRYALLFTAVSLGFAFVTLIAGLSLGVRETIREKASRYFAGDVSVIGYGTSKNPYVSDPRAVIDLVRNSVRGIRNAAPRTVYYRTDCNIFFSGQTIRQRRLVGIDINAEAREFSGLRFVSGGTDGMSEGKGILISRVAAKLLGAGLGDDVNLLLTTDTGQYNTATLYVKGVFDETSLFGYAAYMRRDELNALVGRPPDSATDIAIFASPGHSADRVASDVRNALKKCYPVFPPLRSRAAMAAAVDSTVEAEDTMAVLTLDANLSQIKEMIDAVIIVMYFVLAVFVAIIMVGILNTYRMIVYERTAEIGTMRALGMRKGAVRRLFIYEAAGLGITASCAGFLLGLALLSVASMADLGGLPASGMFTRSGRLAFFLDPGIVCLNFSIMVSAAILAAWGPSRRASEVEPAEALRDS